MFEKIAMKKMSQTVEETTHNNQFLRRLLSIPVFYRVLIANSLIIFIGATGGTWLASQIPNNSYAPTGLIIFITVGWLVSVVMNFVLLRIAFRPLMDLGKVMHRVQEGERSLRAPLTGYDQDADQLASTLNMMLEAINESSRQRAAEIFNAQEEERKRIARELHDETSQVLTSLLISLAVLEESVTSAEARDRIGETRMLAHRTLRAIRNLSTDLRPSALDDLGLVPALRWYIKEYQQKFSLEVSFQISGFKERLPTTMETALYRIIQEALTNIARHAHAHKVSVALKEDANALSVVITDDGHGFDAEQLQKPPGPGQERGWGLVGMRERASLLDGTLTIESKIGQGTSIHARIPQQPSTTRKNISTTEVSIS